MIELDIGNLSDAESRPFANAFFKALHYFNRENGEKYIDVMVEAIVKYDAKIRSEQLRNTENKLVVLHLTNGNDSKDFCNSTMYGREYEAIKSKLRKLKIKDL